MFNKHRVRLIALIMVAAVMLSTTPALATVAKSKAKTKAKPKTAAVKTVKIGLVTDLSGVAEEEGKETRNGFMLAIEQAKFKAGNYKVATVIADDKGDQNTGYDEAKRLINTQKVQVLIGGTGEASARRISELCNIKELPFVSALNSDPSLTVRDGKRARFSFRTCLNDQIKGRLGAVFATKYLNAQRPVVIYNRDDGYSGMLASDFKTSIENQGGQLAAYLDYGETDELFTDVLKKAAAAKADVIFLPDAGYHVNMLSAQATGAGLNCPLLGTVDWMDSYINIARVEGHYMVGGTLMTDSIAENKRFMDLYQKRFGEKPGATALMTYDATNIVLNAVKRANSNNPEKIRVALQTTKNFPTVAGKMSFDANGNSTKPGIAIKVTKGMPSFITKVDHILGTVDSKPDSLTQQIEKVKGDGSDLVPVTVDGIALEPFKHPTAQYACLIPRGWVYLAKTGSLIMLTPANSDKAYFQVETSQDVADLITQYGLMEGAKEVKEIIEQSEDMKVSGPNLVTVDGVQGVDLIEESTENGVQYWALERLVLYNGVGYIITIQIDTKQFDKYKDALKECLDSVQFTEIPQKTGV